MDKTSQSFTQLILKIVDILLNRKLMALIAGIACVLLILSYMVPPEFASSAIQKYSLWFAVSGRGGVLIHWGFDADERIKSYQKCRQIKTHLENLGSDQVMILLQFVQSGKNSIHFSSTEKAVQDLVYKGILYRPAQQMNGLGQIAYNVTPQAAKFLRYKKFQEILLKATSKED